MSALNEKSLGKRLQVARQNAGLTQQMLCHKANLSYSTLAKIERGAIKSPSIFTVQTISEALGVSLDTLLGIESGKPAITPKKVSKSGVKFVYFDVNGCLVHFFQSAFSQLAMQSGEQLDVVESAYWHYNDAVCRGDITMEDFNKAFARQLHLDSIDWRDYYMKAVEPIPEMHDLLVWASKNYHVGLLTNIMPGFVDEMLVKHLIPDVPYDTIVDSSKVRAIKPEPEIFQVASERTGCKPEEVLLIDDSRANLQAAGHFGWRVLWFDDYRPKEAVERVRAALEPAD
ncbi:MAG TPA: HAD-IA family hydrolase [Candidatus Saccharimonadales bacterium]|nr:HAD-IA family hydrolase [Candidatus Saccharimonadales bacterium]